MASTDPIVSYWHQNKSSCLLATPINMAAHPWQMEIWPSVSCDGTWKSGCLLATVTLGNQGCLAAKMTHGNLAFCQLLGKLGYPAVFWLQLHLEIQMFVGYGDTWIGMNRQRCWLVGQRAAQICWLHTELKCGFHMATDTSIGPAVNVRMDQKWNNINESPKRWTFYSYNSIFSLEH